MSSLAAAARAAYQPLSLEGKVALVTGASSGIGRAIALMLAGQKASILPVGRNEAELRRTAELAAEMTQTVAPYCVDLTSTGTRTMFEDIHERFGRLDILVHSAGTIAEGRMGESQLEDFDAQYQANVRAPYALTQAVLPLLKQSRGQIVFINSTVGLTAKRAGIGQYAATQHAVKALAESLREELNPEGVRVIAVYPGRTATPRQEMLHARAGRPYCPELLLQPEDVAAVVINALTLRLTAEVTDIVIRPMKNTWVHAS